MDFGDINKLVILSKNTCPYCKDTKRIVDDLVKDGTIRPNEVTIVDVDDGTRVNKKKFTDAFATVPQIFINGKHILGGSTNFRRLYESGELDDML